MKLELTAREIVDLGIWEEYCNWSGMSLWAFKDGQIQDDTEIILSKADMLHLFGKEVSFNTRRYLT